MLDDISLTKISGGKSNYSLFLILGGIVTFIIGVFDGYFRPLKCND